MTVPLAVADHIHTQLLVDPGPSLALTIDVFLCFLHTCW